MKKNWLLIALALTLLLTSCSQPAASPTPTAASEIITATGLSPEENMKKYGIPAVIVPFDYPVPDGLIEDPVEKEAMIDAKIAHLQEVNRLFWGDAPGTPEERQEIFDELWSAIDAEFVAFNRLDLDWDAFYDEYYGKIGQVQSYGEYTHIITLMSYVLEEGHAWLVPGRAIEAFDKKGIHDAIVDGSTIPWFTLRRGSLIGACYTVTPDEELVIYRIWDGSPNPYNFKVGDEIVGFNGVPWEDWILRLETAGIPLGLSWGAPGGADTARRYNLLSSGMGNVNLFEKINIKRVDTGEIETMDVVYIEFEEEDLQFMPCIESTETEGLVSVDDPNQPLSFEDDPMFIYGIIKDENIGYMYIKNTAPPNPAKFADQFEEAVFSLMDTDGLIIDLRHNGGGDDPYFFYRGLAHLVKGTEDRQLYGKAVRAPGSDDRTRLIDVTEAWGKGWDGSTADAWFREIGDRYLRGNIVYPSPFRADNPDLYYENPIIVMTGPGCFSGGDWLLQLLSKFPEFTIIGRDPNGSHTTSLGRVRTFWLSPKGDYVTFLVPALAPYSVDEQPIDHLSRRTHLVDVEVWFTKEDVINGVDTVREYAIQLIREARSEKE